MNKDNTTNCIEVCNKYCVIDKYVFLYRLKNDPDRDFFDFKYRDILLHPIRLNNTFRERCVEHCLKKWLY